MRTAAERITRKTPDDHVCLVLPTDSQRTAAETIIRLHPKRIEIPDKFKSLQYNNRSILVIYIGASPGSDANSGSGAFYFYEKSVLRTSWWENDDPKFRFRYERENGDIWRRIPPNLDCLLKTIID